jgi:phosphoribosylformylglycinamidine synthase
MTSYPRTEKGRAWEENIDPRKWLYQTPEQILIKASNGASDFGNKFGQPLICGSLLTFEHVENGKKFGYDKVIMLAGGVGYANKRDALKGKPESGEKIIVLGGDNYRIGMGGGAVSSVNTGEYSSGIELNAVQRANPEMQKRVANVIRSLAESDENPIVSIHDHGAGGHLNCLSELVEETGGIIEMDKGGGVKGGGRAIRPGAGGGGGGGRGGGREERGLRGRGPARGGRGGVVWDLRS